MLDATVSLALLLLHILQGNSPGTPCTNYKLTGCSHIPPPLLAAAATGARTTGWADDPASRTLWGALFATLLGALSWFSAAFTWFTWPPPLLLTRALLPGVFLEIPRFPPGGGHSTFFQVGVCCPDFRSMGLANWQLLLKRGACERKIFKFGGLWAENFQI